MKACCSAYKTSVNHDKEEAVLKIVKQLVELGSSLTAVSDSNKNALMYAAEYLYNDVVEYLLSVMRPEDTETVDNVNNCCCYVMS